MRALQAFLTASLLVALSALAGAQPATVELRDAQG